MYLVHQWLLEAVRCLFIYFNILQIKLTHVQDIGEIKGEKIFQDLRVSWQLVPAAVIIVYLLTTIIKIDYLTKCYSYMSGEAYYNFYI